jgi:hypothetical protein
MKAESRRERNNYPGPWVIRKIIRHKVGGSYVRRKTLRNTCVRRYAAYHTFNAYLSCLYTLYGRDLGT